MAGLPPDPAPPLGPEEEVTQYGRRDATWFKNRPEEGNVLSAIRGRVSLEVACDCVKGKPPKSEDGIRFASVECLLTSGFAVLATPHRLNRLHVSIEYSGTWDDTVSEGFDSCFGEPVFREDD